jgi:hypothetical protein
VQVHQTPVGRSDPQAAVAVAEHSSRDELLRRTRRRIRFDLPICQPPKSAARGDQEAAVVALAES